MKVLSTNYYPKYSQRPFGMYSVAKFKGDSPFCTTTMFLRGDIDWKSFVYMISRLYKNVPKVNVICHACSDGEEAYSLAMVLKTMLKEGAEKFFPIIARDFDEDNIRIAKTGKYKISKRELELITEYCGASINDYLEIEKCMYGIDVNVKNSLSNNVLFEQANILEDVQNIPSENTILSCRNFWLYLSPIDRINLADKLSRHLDSSSIIVLGSFDINNGVKEILKKAGFCETPLAGVLSKSGFLSNMLAQEKMQYY